jgi:hypothetical protein
VPSPRSCRICWVVVPVWRNGKAQGSATWSSGPVSICKTHHIYVTDADHTWTSAKKEFDALSEIADLVAPSSTNREEFIEECKSGAFDGVVAAYRTFDSVTITGRIDSALVENLPKSLKFIAHNGVCFAVAQTIFNQLTRPFF